MSKYHITHSHGSARVL